MVGGSVQMIDRPQMVEISTDKKKCALKCARSSSNESTEAKGQKMYFSTP